MHVIGHRGHGSEPENTMRAFRKGLEMGADRIEIDIQPDADGDYVVIHDPTVDRTTNGTGAVASLTTAQIKQLDAGKGEKLPLFSEVLNWAVQNDVALDVEVKHPHPGDETRLANIIQNAGLRDPWVMSFNGPFVERFEKLAPEVTTGILIHERPLFDKSLRAAGAGLALGFGTALVTGLNPLLGAGLGTVAGAVTGFGLTRRALRTKNFEREVDVHIPGRRLLNEKLVDKAHAAGKEIAVYTVDKPEQAEKFLDWGVDAIISNFPERIPRS